MQVFRSHAPQASPQPTPLPHSLPFMEKSYTSITLLQLPPAPHTQLCLNVQPPEHNRLPNPCLLVTSVGSTVREQAECCGGKPVVICILPFRSCVTLKLSNAAVSEKTLHIPDAEYVVLFVERFMMWRYGQTDRQTDRRTHTTTTVTIAVHAGRGLIIPDKDTWMVSCSFVCLRCVITLWVFVFGASAHFFIPLHFRGIMFVGINLLAHTLLVYIIIVLGCLHVKNILLINNLRLIVYSGQNFINRRFGNYIAAFFSLKYHGSE